jgi:DNA-binding GntR family transcriptional regulator
MNGIQTHAEIALLIATPISSALDSCYSTWYIVVRIWYTIYKGVCMANPDSPFQKIEPQTLSTQVVDMLRDAILSGDVQPGEHLNERQLAKQMGVSRVPIREAFRRLAYEGLVVSTPNRGTYVRYFDQTDVAEIFDLRAVLEGLACQMIASNRGFSEEDYALLERFIEEQQQAIEAGDYERWVETEIKFHEYILNRAGAQRLLKAWQNLHVQCLFATRKGWATYLRAYGSHPSILEALREGDPDAMIPFHQKVYERIKKSAMQLIRDKTS